MAPAAATDALERELEAALTRARRTNRPTALASAVERVTVAAVNWKARP